MEIREVIRYSPTGHLTFPNTCEMPSVVTGAHNGLLVVTPLPPKLYLNPLLVK